jgi:hypothetical protein
VERFPRPELDRGARICSNARNGVGHLVCATEGQEGS